MKILPLFIEGLSRLTRFLFSLPVVGRLFDKISAGLACVVCFYSGSFTVSSRRSTDLPVLKIYQFVGCPFCRRVDETISALALDVVYFSCPRVTLKQYGVVDGSRYRPEVMKLGGKGQFPFLVDESKNILMYESKDINDYLIKTYGNPSQAEKLSIMSRVRMLGYNTSQNFFTGNLMRSLFRNLPEHGILKIPSKDLSKAKSKLTLYGYEGSVDTLQVRERLCALEQVYLYKTVPIGATEKRKEYFKKVGKGSGSMVWPIFRPLLEVDDGKSVRQFIGTKQILSFLKSEVQTGEGINESFMDYSTKGASKSHGTM